MHILIASIKVNESDLKISSRFLSKESFSWVSAHIWDESKNLPTSLIISNVEMFG